LSAAALVEHQAAAALVDLELQLHFHCHRLLL
jgi:hypothetical protein